MSAENKLSTKKILITGASKGIGKAIAQRATEEGHHLILTARNSQELADLKSEIQNQTPHLTVYTFASDLSTQEGTQELTEYMVQQHPDLDVLINNAGIFIPGLIENGSEEDFELMMQVNFYAAFHLTRGLLPAMIGRKKGHIINICSIAGQDPYPRAGLYSITKFAMQGFSRCLRDELKEKGIKVTTVYPGATWSNSWSGADLPKSRIMQASDVAECVISSIRLSDSAVLEEIVLRPQLGDLP
jgi:short-subunit dehydrogenase